mmetsp:Transcript_19659/g.30348  ORF Transcript_19659/g.30348 Transcript_19659/m.30348 type:complete len:155 (+) Transcript_19659:256-720(+)
MSEDLVLGIGDSLKLVEASDLLSNNRINFKPLYSYFKEADSLEEDGSLKVYLQIQYQLPYNKNREGLNSYTDASTNDMYVYSQLIFHCWAVFPCFDQPDIKAVFNLTVLTKEDWVVATNAPEKKVHLYTTSPPIESGAPPVKMTQEEEEANTLA